jgi:hypothetical protein
MDAIWGTVWPAEVWSEEVVRVPIRLQLYPRGPTDGSPVIAQYL